MPEPPTELIPAPRERCRAITTDGHRCKNGATYNGHLCWPHAHHRHPVLPDPTHVVIPLLEDHASIQLVLSQVTHGLLTHKLDTDRARTIIYSCQIAASTMPRPPRLPTPQPGPTDANQTSAPDGQMAGPQPNPADFEPTSGAAAPTPASSALSASSGVSPLHLAGEEDTVYRLALDYEGIVSGDGDLPAPSSHWQPASPEATPWDLLHAAPNQSKPTPRDPHDPDTHCDCPICGEIEKMKGNSWDHPHLQPVVNPYCKRNRPGCEGPGSPTQCSYCEGVYKYDPRPYDRRRRQSRRDSSLSEESHASNPRRRASSGERVEGGEPRSAHGSAYIDDDFDPALRLPNPIPEQFPDDDPMIRSYIPLSEDLDLKAESEPAGRPPHPAPRTLYPDSTPYPAPCPTVIPKSYYPPTPAPSTKPHPSNQGVPPAPAIRPQPAPCPVPCNL